MKKNGILTIFQIRQSQVKEIPASNSDSNAEDLIYGINFSDETSEKSLTASTEMNYNSDIAKDEKKMSVREIVRNEEKKSKIVKRYKNSRAYRQEKLHSTKSLRTYRIKQKFYVDDDGKKKPEKNILGQPLFDAVYVTIGGNRGIIDESNRYDAKWCIVDTDNKFVYNSKQYEIHESVEQYKVNKDSQCNMDSILVVPTPTGLKFFDRDYQEVVDKLIKQV